MADLVHAPQNVQRRTLKIRNKLGLHARAAVKFVQLAGKFKSEITVRKDGQDANGKSIGTPGVVTKFSLVGKSGLAGDAVVDEPVFSTTPDTAFRWDSSSSQWIYNISTKSLAAKTVYTYKIELNDGSSISFKFGLK